MNLNEFISNALNEDIGNGDHTTLACIGNAVSGKAEIIVKQKGIIAGIEITVKIFNNIDKALVCQCHFSDGQTVKPDDVVMTISGQSRSILKGERLVLNCMQRMSAIASKTNEMVKEIEGLKTKILDTRKTTPNFRYFEKLAVKIGGGENHRFGLYDMIMIKDNHIDFSGGIENSIKKTLKYLKKNNLKLKICIEARNLRDVKEILKTDGCDRIMLDNFSLDDTKKALTYINNSMETEATGGITLKNVREIAETGVDYISLGAITHSAGNMDISLNAKLF